MPDQSKNIKRYSAADIERYLDGEMSPQEMHELEKAALEDSLLAEALEGFKYTATPSADVAALKARLRDAQQKGHIIPLNKQKDYSRLFRVAAMFILLFGTGWLIYQFAINKPETNVSLNDQAERQDKTTTEKTTTEKSVEEQQAPIEQKTSKSTAKEENKDNSNPLTKTKKPSHPVIHPNNEPGGLVSTQSPTQDTALPDRNAQTVTMAQDQEAVADQTAVAAAPVSPESRERAIIGYKRAMPMKAEVQMKEGILRKAEISDNPKVEITQEGNQVIITLKESPDSVNEYVLKQTRKDTSSKRGPRIIVEEAEPEESWNTFGEYLSENLPENLITEKVRGTVKFSFEVSPSGKPVNIQVEKSLCQKCDEETLKLLEEGPKWKRKAKRGKVIFSF